MDVQWKKKTSCSFFLRFGKYFLMVHFFFFFFGLQIQFHFYGIPIFQVLMPQMSHRKFQFQQQETIFQKSKNQKKTKKPNKQTEHLHIADCQIKWLQDWNVARQRQSKVEEWLTCFSLSLSLSHSFTPFLMLNEENKYSSTCTRPLKRLSVVLAALEKSPIVGVRERGDNLVLSVPFCLPVNIFFISTKMTSPGYLPFLRTPRLQFLSYLPIFIPILNTI